MIAPIIAFLRGLLARGEPTLSLAGPRDATAIAGLHAASFHRGWIDGDLEVMLLDRAVLAHRATRGRHLLGFILSRMVVDEAEILSVAVSIGGRGKGLGRKLLDLHLRRLAGFGVRAVFLEVGQDNVPALRLYRRAGFQEIGRRDAYYRDAAGNTTTALVLRRDLFEPAISFDYGRSYRGLG